MSDPETGMMLPDPKFVAPNATIPEAAAGTEWIYPYTSSPHYHSQNAGPWCALRCQEKAKGFSADE